MGSAYSKYSSGGKLKGAYAPPLPGVVLPPKLDPTVHYYTATVPAGKKGGDSMVATLEGQEISVTIPREIRVPKEGTRAPKPGDKFRFKWGFRDNVIASTLPSLPGTTVVEAKPMIFSNVSESFANGSRSESQTSMSHKVASLMQEAQTQLLQQAVEQGCNAVLSINCNVSTDSSGERGYYKIVIVTLVGTPCVVMKSEDLPAIQTKAYVVPAYVL